MQPAISQRRRGRGDMERNRLNERRMRVLGFPHCPNFRDLGGYKTADGKVFGYHAYDSHKTGACKYF